VQAIEIVGPGHVSFGKDEHRLERLLGRLLRVEAGQLRANLARSE
jgi:hypothetical protein